MYYSKNISKLRIVFWKRNLEFWWRINEEEEKLIFSIGKNGLYINIDYI